MVMLLWRLARGYRLRPWSSPYLRWRIETYWGWHAEQITFGEFWRFTWSHRKELVRYLRWADRIRRRRVRDVPLQSLLPPASIGEKESS
jgi:hypothetical protein